MSDTLCSGQKHSDKKTLADLDANVLCRHGEKVQCQYPGPYCRRCIFILPAPDQVATSMADTDDEQSFRQAMHDVRPLRGSKLHVDSGPKPNTGVPQSTLRARRKAAEQGRPATGAALSEAWIEPIDPEQFINFARPGIQDSRLRQLRQGGIPIEYQLDLHGYKIDEARELIYEFIKACRQRRLGCVRIIHGKSHRSKERESTLKSHTNHWLKQISDVLAFCSAPPSAGGTGSVLVLLRRK